jgi:HSP20 family molecular chaperone IbpA
MNTIISNLTSRSRVSGATNPEGFRRPNYDCREQGDALKLLVYIPGVDSSGVEITASGPDLMVTAKKKHFVRVNFGALNLEAAAKDYRLTLRLGKHLDYSNLSAEIKDGVLNILIPKRESTSSMERLRHAA